MPVGDAESTPTDTFDAVEVVPGEVLVTRGVEINPARPRFSAVSLVSSVVRSPEVRITFDNTGRVIDADLITSTGSANVDFPIRNSLFRWTARPPAPDGPDAWRGPRTFRFTLLLVR